MEVGEEGGERTFCERAAELLPPLDEIVCMDDPAGTEEAGTEEAGLEFVPAEEEAGGMLERPSDEDEFVHTLFVQDNPSEQVVPHGVLVPPAQHMTTVPQTAPSEWLL